MPIQRSKMVLTGTWRKKCLSSCVFLNLLYAKFCALQQGRKHASDLIFASEEFLISLGRQMFNKQIITQCDYRKGVFQDYRKSDSQHPWMSGMGLASEVEEKLTDQLLTFGHHLKPQWCVQSLILLSVASSKGFSTSGFHFIEIFLYSISLILSFRSLS